MKRSLTQLGAALVSAVLTVVVLVALMATVPPAQARGAAEVGIDSVALSALPDEARRTHRLILSGGPFPYPRKDGSVFGNRERRLPREPRGFYLEYTVPTPGSRDRGARRIICGGNLPTAPEVCYYTQDHYTSFRRIVQ
jgi:ribonuclease T1